MDLFSFHRCHAISTIFRLNEKIGIVCWSIIATRGLPQSTESTPSPLWTLSSLLAEVSHDEAWETSASREDKVLAEIENRFSGNDQDVLRALGDVTLSDFRASDSFDLPVVAGYYNFDKELLQADQRLFNRFKKTYVEKAIKTLAEVVLHEKSLYEITPEFSKVASIFGRHFRNIMLSGTFVQQTPAVKDTVTPWGSVDSMASLSSVLSAPIEIKSLENDERLRLHPDFNPPPPSLSSVA